MLFIFNFIAFLGLFERSVTLDMRKLLNWKVYEAHSDENVGNEKGNSFGMRSCS